MLVKQLNELQEKRGEKLKEADALFNKAAAEKRQLSTDELTKVESIQSEAEGMLREYTVRAKQVALESEKQFKLSSDEKRNISKFDYSKLIAHMHRSAKGTNVKALDGVEAEMIQEGEREAREAGIESGGIFLPRVIARGEKRDMTATGTTSVTGDQGGQSIQTNVSGLLDDFFSASVMRQAGATVLEGLVGDLRLPRIVAGTAPGKKAENANADEVNPTLASLTLSPKRLPAYIDISEQLMKQSSSNIEAFLRNHLTAQMLGVQEVSFFHGNGTNEPTGLASTVGIGSVAGGTDGLAPALSHIIGLETAVDTTNALLGRLSYISNGQVRGKLKQTPKVASTDSRMILEDNGLINGYNAYWTNAISRTLTKGSSGAVCSAIFFGNFADFFIGYWGGVSLELVRDKANAIAGQYTLVASTYYDAGVVRPKSFAAMLDAKAA